MPEAADYMKSYRRRNPEQQKYNHLANEARRAAVKKLTEAHAREFYQLLNLERLSRGLPSQSLNEWMR